MTGNVMSEVFQDVDWLRSFYFWVVLFFISGAVFSFRSIDKTRVMQVVIVGVRVVSILMLVGGAVFLFCRDGIK